MAAIPDFNDKQIQILQGSSYLKNLIGTLLDLQEAKIILQCFLLFCLKERLQL
jgi:hypothetical protein